MTVRDDRHTPDEVEIITREPAEGRHPHPSQNGRIVPFRGVNRLLLADETERHECDKCGWTAKKIQSIVAHMQSHTARPETGYPEKLIRYVLRETRRYRRSHDGATLTDAWTHVRNLLNARGLVTAHNTPWTVSSVMYVYRRWVDQIRVHVPRVREPVAGKIKSSSSSSSSLTPHDIHRDTVAAVLDRLETAVKSAADQFARVALSLDETRDDLRRFRETLDNPEVTRKIKAYDELRLTLAQFTLDEAHGDNHSRQNSH